ncbi:MAG: DUF4345 family protein [Anaerolineaceae bacterium]|nr:DUF4345 family protein [Anaerolineaceae bacterium]MBN2677860.1 DUF4345 family protein [Anaerolineaceae bacterium]
MDILTILKIIFAIATVATGLLALIKPTAVYGFTGIKAEGARGISEIRAIFGGLFIALGVAPFIFGETAYLVLGLGYLVIAVVRLASIFIDRSRDSSNWISLGIEILFGVILILR